MEHREGWQLFYNEWNTAIRNINRNYGLPEGHNDFASVEIVHDLWRRYQEEQRHYHTTDHLVHCFEEFQEARHLAVNPNILALGLAHHDAVYDVTKMDNEQKSAELVFENCKKLNFPKVVGNEAGKLAWGTEHFSERVFTACDMDLMLDIDFAILGQSEEVFEQYDQDIGKEYAWVTEVFGEDEYKSKRKEVLETLAQGEIYRTDFFKKKYEKQAKENLKRKIKELS